MADLDHDLMAEASGLKLIIWQQLNDAEKDGTRATALKNMLTFLECDITLYKASKHADDAKNLRERIDVIRRDLEALDKPVIR